jgi:hypothetical protein
MSEKVVEYKTPWTFIFFSVVITALLTCVFNFHIFFLPPPAMCNENISVLRWDIMGLPFVMVLFTGLLLNYVESLRKYLSMEKWVYLYISVLAAACFSTYNNPWGGDASAAFTYISLVSPEVTRYLPEYIVFPPNVAELLLEGVGNITKLPWNIILPHVMWFFLLQALWLGVAIGFTGIMRRLWVDVEKLPFPVITMAYLSMSGLENVRRREWVGRLPLILGFILGFVLEVPISFSTLFPWFPDIYSRRTNSCGPGIYHLLVPGQPWIIGFDTSPLEYVIAFLIPLNILISVPFYFFILNIALTIAWYNGYYTGIENMGYCGRNWCYPTPFNAPPLHFSTIITGIGIGFMVISLFRQRQYILDTLKKAFGKTSPLSEENEPTSYRVAWALFIGFFILMAIFLTLSGVSPWLSFVLVLTSFVTWYVSTQIWARMVYLSTPCFWLTPAFIKIMAWPTESSLPPDSMDRSIAPLFSRSYIGHRSINGLGNIFYTCIGSYKLGQLVGVHPRNVIKILIPVLLTAIFVGQMMGIVIPAMYGARLRWGTRLVSAINLSWWSSTLWNLPSVGSMLQLAPWLVIGFVFMVSMEYLCARFLWLPHPLGAIVAWWWLAPWSAFLIAAIAKYLVLRIGGSKLYEERGLPFVGGFILGHILEKLVAVVLFYSTYPTA